MANKFKVTPQEFEVQLSERFNKAVTVNSSAEAGFVKSLEIHNELRDLEAGINPKGATHEIVKDKKGHYRIKRVGFSAI